MTNEYTIKIRSQQPPQVFIGGSLAGGKVVSISDDMPDSVSLAWLAERFPSYSKETIRKQLEPIKKGSAGKAIYDRVAAYQLLSNAQKGLVDHEKTSDLRQIYAKIPQALYFW